MSKNKKHWIVLILACCMATVSIGLTLQVVGVFLTPVSDSLNVLRGSFSLHITLGSIVIAFSSLVVSNLLRRYSFKVLFTIGTLMVGICTILMGFTRSMPIFYILSMIRGAGSTLFGIISITTLITNWFVKNHGLATSIVLSFSGISGAVGSPIFASLIKNYGWEKSYIILGIAMILIMLPVLIYPFKFSPFEEGLVPYGYKKENDTNLNQNINKPVKAFNYFSIAFIIFFIFAVTETMITGYPGHFPGYAETIGKANIASLLLSAAMVGNILSKFVIGLVSDKFGAFKATLLMIIFNIAGIILMIFTKADISIIIGAVLFGSVFAIGAVGFSLLTRDFFGRENYLKVFPIVTFAANMGGAFAVSLVGYAYDFLGSYSIAFYAALAINIINIIGMFIVKNMTENKF